MGEKLGRPKRILLTGGIASGKSFASDFLAKLGAKVIDTDKISRAMTSNQNRKGREALKEIQQIFGSKVVNEALELNRAEMRRIIFNDPEKKEVLEKILHPRILAETKEQLAEFEDRFKHSQNSEGEKQYSLIVVPIISPSSPYLAMADEVLVIETDYETQVARIMARDGNDRALAEKIIAAQIPRLERRKLGDRIIINDSKTYVEQVLRRLDREYSTPL